VRLLLDTHALIWWLSDDRELSDVARSAIADPASVVYVSAAGAWEMSIKQARGRLRMSGDLAAILAQGDLVELPITVAHAELAGALPPHHADPFDRMLVAQATLEGLTVVTRDPDFALYGAPLLEA
jgi:PIN domain nuclease of toxin-antitoxin system